MNAPLLLLLTLAAPDATAQDTPAPPADTAAYDYHLNQARLFIKKGWLSDALGELEAAAEADPAGFEARWLIAQVRFEQLDARGAWEAADEAAPLARTDDERMLAEQLRDYLQSTYGVLVIEGPYEDAASLLQLEPTSPVLDPDLKRWIDKVALGLRSRTLLPASVAVPAGVYAVNGQEVEVVAGEERSVALSRDDLGAKGFAKLLVPRVEIGAGVGVLFSERVANLQPSLEGELGFSQPFGRAVFGAVLDYSLRSFQVDDGTAFNPRAVGGGLRVGTELMVGGPLAFRPSVGYRYVLVPGVPLSCAGPRPDGDYTCSIPDGGGADATVYAVGRAHAPFGEIAVDWRRAGRTTSNGFGVRAAVEQAFGTIPEDAEAVILDSQDTIGFQVTDRTWTATGVRLLAELSLTL